MNCHKVGAANYNNNDGLLNKSVIMLKSVSLPLLLLAALRPRDCLKSLNTFIPLFLHLQYGSSSSNLKFC